MAKIISMSFGKNSIDCMLSGSIGNEVWYIRNGINYKRKKAVSVSNPKTQGQLDHRARFTALIKFLQPLKDLLRVGFESQTGNMSAFNAAMSCNYKTAIGGAYPEFRIDYSKVMVSCGKLTGAFHPAVTSTITGKVDFTWEDNSCFDDAWADDRVMLVVYSIDRQEAVTIIGGHFRAGGSQRIALPALFSGDEVQCFIGFQNARQSIVSDSKYVGGLVVK